MSKEVFTTRQIIVSHIVSEGPQCQRPHISNRIMSALDYLPFDWRTIEPIASRVVEDPRDVVIANMRIVSETIAPLVMKIGYTSKDGRHAEPLERAKSELKWSQFFQKTPLGPHCITSYPLVIGASKDQQFDLRIQKRVITGRRLQHLPIGKLAPEQYQSLIRFHDAFVWTLFQYNIVPEFGFTLDQKIMVRSPLIRWLLYLPLASLNIILEDQTNSIFIVDTGFPLVLYDEKSSWLKRQIKRFVVWSLLQGERIALQVLYVAAKLKQIQFSQSYPQ